MELAFEAELWKWQGKGAWYFVTLPLEYSEDIKMITSSPKRGFGSVQVEVTIGKTVWKTSIFPDTKSKTYLLPIKKGVRKSEALEVRRTYSVKLRLIEV